MLPPLKLLLLLSGRRASSRLAAASVAASGRGVRVAWSDGCQSTFHAAFLLSNCDAFRQRHTGQRLAGSNAADCAAIASVAPHDGGGALRVSFAPPFGGMDGFFRADWLDRHRGDESAIERRRKAAFAVTSDADAKPPSAVAEVQFDEGTRRPSLHTVSIAPRYSLASASQ